LTPDWAGVESETDKAENERISKEGNDEAVQGEEPVN